MKTLSAKYLLIVALWCAALAPCRAFLDPETDTFLTPDPAGMIDGPNRYAYVNQNPWTKFDPKGLSAYSAVGNYSQSLSDDGHPTLALGVTVAQQAWNLFSLGTASKNGAVEDQVNDGKISAANGLAAMAGNGGVAAASLALGGTTGVALKGTLGAVGAGMAGGATQATTQIAGQRAVADATGTPYQGTAGSDALQVGLSAGLGGLFGRAAAPDAAAQAEGVGTVNNPPPAANPLEASAKETLAATVGQEGVQAPGKGPNFIGAPDGQVFAVPDGATGPTPTRAPGMQFTGGSGGNGLDPRVTGVRFMDANAIQGARAVYMNGSGQTVNPSTGGTVPMSDPTAHFYINP
jgi:hypothetical protein